MVAIKDLKDPAIDFEPDMTLTFNIQDQILNLLYLRNT